MQYYRIGETLEPLDSLPPEDEAVLAVLRPDELHTAPLPQGRNLSLPWAVKACCWWTTTGMRERSLNC